MDDHFDVSGRVAIVTGASAGLGRHFALTLARAGAKVALGARRVDRLGELARQIEAFDGRAIPLALDVTDPESVRAAVEAAETELGAVSVLVNNAGISHRETLLDFQEADWDRIQATNVKGAWLMAQESARHMVRLGHGGSIINIASILGLGARTATPAYITSKGAVISMTRAMAVDLAPHGIRVNAIAPGYFETDMTRAFLALPEGQAQLERIPLGRVGTPEELEGPLLLLASEASRFMTGSILVVDGGQTALA